MMCIPAVKKTAAPRFCLENPLTIIVELVKELMTGLSWDQANHLTRTPETVVRFRFARETF
jgi:hypothetical protein